jgi:uncharacterized membrane protein
VTGVTTKPSIPAKAPLKAMNAKTERASEERKVSAGVYYVLLAGMYVSTTLYIVGIVLELLRPTFVPLTPDYIKQYYHWTAVVHGLARLDPMAIMLVATALLILTPVVRVLVSIYAFATEGDRKFVAVTSIVFAIIVATAILGLLGLR